MSAKTIKVRIPVTVASNGRWCANGFPGTDEEPDWAFMEDVVIGEDDSDRLTMKRGWITVELPVPDLEEFLIDAGTFSPTPTPGDGREG